MTVRSVPALPLVLRKRLHMLSTKYNKWLLGLGLLLLAIPFALILMAGAGEPDFWPTLWREMTGDYEMVLIVILVPVLIMGFWFIHHHERLELTETGIAYRSPLRGPLAFLRGMKPDWRYNWSEIRGMTLRPGGPIPKKGLRRREIVLDTGPGATRKLEPYLWHTQPDIAGLTFGELLRLNKETYRRAVEESPLYRILSERGMLDDSQAWSSDAQSEGVLSAYPGGSYDLTRHPGMMAVLAGLTGLGGYAVVDGLFLAPWRPLEAMPVGPFLAVGLVALVLAATLARSAPPLERWAVALIFTATAAGAVYPALLRINAATDEDGPQRYLYYQVETARFEPMDSIELPRLEFNDYPEFWEVMPDGMEREFVLSRGSFGFWQLDKEEVRKAQRQYFSPQG